MAKAKKQRATEPVAVPVSFFSPVTQAVSGTTLSVDMSQVEAGGPKKSLVRMSDATIAHAYLLAFGRFEAAAGGRDAQIALFELLTWLDVLAERPSTNGACRPSRCFST